jgi:hypothetical protein
MEKEFIAEQMIEFANAFSADDITEEHLQDYRDTLKQKEEQEYQMYLALKAKYEKVVFIPDEYVKQKEYQKNMFCW